MRTLIKILEHLVIAAICVVVYALIAKYLYNWIMPDLFGVKQTDYWHMLGLIILVRMIFLSSDLTKSSND